jgi:hypothetical protein
MFGVVLNMSLLTQSHYVFYFTDNGGMIIANTLVCLICEQSGSIC